MRRFIFSPPCFETKLALFFARVKEKFHKLLPVLFIIVLAVSRIPHLLPPDFSVIYAFVFCAGVYFRGAMKWWLPFGAMLVTDVALNIFYYHMGAAALLWLLPNYVVYAGMIWLGKKIGARASFLKLLGGGLLGAIAFYLVTNTLSWLAIPEYAKSFAGWVQALWTGLPGLPPTWEFFRNAFLSTGLFTSLFVAAEKLTSSAESPADKTAGAREPESEIEAEPQEADA
jgi:hypothetical protein